VAWRECSIVIEVACGARSEVEVDGALFAAALLVLHFEAPGKMASFKNYYHVLGIDSTAGDAAIKAAFRRLALRHHPDRAKDKRTAQRFREIREAYEVLSDPEKRRQYDHVYRAQGAALRPIGPRVERRKTGARRGIRSGGGLGITLDVLGLRVGLAVDAELTRPAARSQKGPRRRAQ
jgi:curved DNA-binding protein CbpA